MRALLLALFVLAMAAPAGASTIVFACDVNLCALDPETGKRRALTRDGTGGRDYYDAPALSSDGRLLAFWQENRPFLADRRARNRRTIPAPRAPRGNLYAPVLAPRGRGAFYFHGYAGSIATSVRLCRTPDIVRRRATCGNVLPGGRSYWGWGPRGTILSVGSDERTDLCVTTLNGRCSKLLVRATGGDTFFMAPATSPDDRYVAATVDPGDTSGEMRIVLYEARTGRRVRTVTRGHTDYPPTFSPDGRFIAFRRDAVVEGGVVFASLCIVGIRGGRVRCPIRHERELGRPSWGG